MTDNLVLCPFCGTEMRLEADSVHVWAKCTNEACLACGPKRWRPDFNNLAECDFWAVCKKIAFAAAQQRYTPPITLEELKAMDGEPVWIVEYPDWGHWELSEDAEDYVCDRDEDFYGLTMPPNNPDPDGKYGLHILGWLAYRDKPQTQLRRDPCKENGSANGKG